MVKLKSFTSFDRIQLLLDAGEILNSSLDYNKNLKDLAQLITPVLADWCAIDILDDKGELVRLSVSHVDPEKIKLAYELQKKYPPEKDYTRGPYKVVNTGTSEYYHDIPEELIKLVSKDEEHFKLLKELGLKSAVTVPLKSGNRKFGVITLITSEMDYNYTEEDLLYFEVLAKRAGLAIENSRLYNEARDLAQKLESQKERLNNIITHIPGLVWEHWEHPNEERKNFISSFVEVMLGYTVEEWFSDPEFPFSIMHPDDVERVRKETMARYKGESKESSIQFRWKRKDGNYIWVESKTSNIYDEHGNPIGARGVVVDISERKLVEERIKLVIESSPNSLIMVNEEGIITLINSQTEKLFGYSRDELIGKSVDKLVPGRYHANHKGFRKNYTEHPETRPMGAGRDLYGLRKDGKEVPIEIGLNPIRTEEGLFVLSSIVDITERKKIEKEISSSLKEKEVLLKEIHHRVKNNLQIITSLLNLQMNLVKNKTVADALKDSQNRIRSMALIHEKLYQSADLSNIDVEDYIKDLVRNIFNSFGTGVKLDMEVAAEKIYLGIDTVVALGLTINELVTNSIKYAFPNNIGKITVKAYRSDNNHATVEVSDNGIGMPSIVKIEETKSLGLQLVTNLVDQIDGEIRIDNSTGTTFKIRFPLTNT